MKKISIIMPLYNAERYLKESLDSILGQSFQDYELICIDDHSDDQTMCIIQSYHNTDDRIKILSNVERQGAAFSRNKGIEEAQGEYLLFLDGDDIFDERLLELAYDKAVESQADIVVYRSICVTSDEIHNKVSSKLDDLFVDKYCRCTFKIEKLKPYEFCDFRTAPWDKLYKREFIEEESLRFQNLMCCNDYYFVNMALLSANRIIYLNTDEIMVYARKHNTPSRISSARDPMCAYMADLRLLEEIVKREKMEIWFQYYYVKAYFHFYMVMKDTKNYSMAKKFYDYLQKEGVTRLQTMGKQYYIRINDYIKEGFDRFLNQCYESAWYEKEGIFQIYLGYNAKKIRNVFDQWRVKGKRIGVWGIEDKAKTFLLFCYQNQLNIEQLMDSDHLKQGKSILNFPPICSPQEGYKKVDVIIFTKKNVMEDAERMINNERNIELIDIVSCLERC